MQRYHYEAINSEGTSFTGQLRATGERDAARQLERRGLSVVALREGDDKARTRRAGRLRTSDVIISIQELATMLTSGVPIADAVGSQAASAHHPRIVAAFGGMARELQRGQAFSSKNFVDSADQLSKSPSTVSRSSATTSPGRARPGRSSWWR